jgi:formiminotetrahydrofolate cyclodeaminase
VRDETIGGWLEDLASEAPAPGGGAAAALNAAVGAALVSMVCNLTIGKPKYAGYEPAMRVALETATRLRTRGLELAEADAVAFEGVIAAYKLPKGTDEEKAARKEAIQAGLVSAADVPLRTAELAAEVIALAGDVLDGANANVLSDVAVAASSARAALDAAVVNVEVNLASLKDAERRDGLAKRLAEHAGAAARAEEIVAAVRERLAR